MRKPLFSNQRFPLRQIILHCSQRPFLYFLTTEILIFGLWAQDAWGNEYFNRSGAIVALLALGLLWLWLHYEKELKTTENYVKAMQKVAGKNKDFYTILTNVSKRNPNLSGELQLQIAVSTYVAVTEGPQLTTDLREVSKSLGFAQIEVAAIGTFIWAFGDLLLEFF